MRNKILGALVICTFVIGPSLAFAEGPGASPSAPTTTKKISRQEAKKKCLEENKNLKVKELKDCIKAKMTS